MRWIAIAFVAVLICGIGAMCAEAFDNEDPLHPTCTYEWHPCHPATTTGDHPPVTTDEQPAETTGEHPTPPTPPAETVTNTVTVSSPAVTLPTITNTVTTPAKTVTVTKTKIVKSKPKVIVKWRTKTKIVYRQTKCKPKPPPRCEGDCSPEKLKEGGKG